MTSPRSLLSLALCSTAAAWSLAGCSGGSNELGSSGQAGAVNSAQAGRGSSGAPGSSGSGAVGQSGSTAGGSAPMGLAGAGAAGAAPAGGAGADGGGAATSGSGGMSAAGSSSSSSGAGGMSTGGSGGGAMPGMSAGCGKAPTIASNMYNNGKNIPITAANLQRRYILSVPTTYDNSKPYKLVIAWHQLDGNDNQMYANKYYHLQPLSNDTTIFVAPNGQKGGAPCSGSGNGEGGCGWPNTNDQDMALADAVVKAVEESFCIDTNRIFATGWSYGGSMSYQTACERPLGAANGFIRAIAVYSGSELSSGGKKCTPSTPVAYYASHGTSDSVLPYNNGVTLAQNFAKANACTWMTPTKVTSGNHMCTDLMGCKTGYPEQFCSFNGDHTPDPRDSGTQTSWEYANAWKFLNQF